MKWEYRTVEMNADGGFLVAKSLNCVALTAKMNELGEEGWELVSAFDVNAFKGVTKGAVLIFKRSLDA